MDPLPLIDRRVPCPLCKTPSDLTDETTLVGTFHPEPKPIWVCPACHHRFVDMRP